MNSARMSPGQDPDEFLHKLDTRRELLNVCDPPERPKDRQFEDIILQALPPEYERIRTSYLEKPDFGIVGIRRRTSAVYAANLARLSSTTRLARHRAAIPAAEQSQKHHLPLLQTRGPFQKHMSPPRQARAAATTSKAVE